MDNCDGCGFDSYDMGISVYKLFSDGGLDFSFKQIDILYKCCLIFIFRDPPGRVAQPAPLLSTSMGMGKELFY